ncbi:hypothetical protein ACWGVR_25720 [Streptomyces xanthophaeus]
MSPAAVFLTVGAACYLVGGTVALNIRGTAVSLARRAARNAELSRHARGDLGAPGQVMSATVYRYLGAMVALCGVVFTLVGLVELA